MTVNLNRAGSLAFTTRILSLGGGAWVCRASPSTTGFVCADDGRLQEETGSPRRPPRGGACAMPLARDLSAASSARGRPRVAPVDDRVRLAAAFEARAADGRVDGVRGV